MSIGDYSTPLLMFLSTIVFGVSSAIVPVLNMELYILFLGGIAPPSLLSPLLLVATLSHMIGKSVMYAAGRGFDKLPHGRFKQRIEAAKAKVDERPDIGTAVIFASALTGLPPFYLVTVLCGVVRFSFLYFFLSGFAGRLLRFGALILVPPLARLLTG